MSNEMAILFSEVQKFRQPLLWIFLCIISIIIVVVSFLLPMVIIICVGIFLFITKLEVEVRESGLFVRFFPLHLSFNKIPVENIDEYRIITYSPIKDYGGWGIRYSSKGKVYNVSGNRGVLLKFKDGSADLCIGSQKPEELYSAIDKLKKKDLNKR